MKKSNAKLDKLERAKDQAILRSLDLEANVERCKEGERPSVRRIVVKWSGGVTSAWCGGWALRNFPKDEVVFLFHDTKEEDPDTYRFSLEMAAKLGHPITERSDGRSFTELCYDEDFLPNNMHPKCSIVLKAQQGDKYIDELLMQGILDITFIYAFSANETERVQRQTAWSWLKKVKVRFPMIEEGVTKQDCANWSTCEMGVKLPSMYEWSDHANCLGCCRGGKAYMLAVKEHRPKVFEQRKQMEKDFGFTFNKRYSLVQIETEGLKRPVGRRESIDIGACECGS